MSSKTIESLTISITKKIPRGGKAATFGYKPYKAANKKDFVDTINSHAIIGCDVEKGHRANEFVTEIYDLVKYDVDEKGEAQVLEKILEKAGLFYVKKPSTNNHKHPYKWHYLVGVIGADNDPYKYKWQVRQMNEALGISLKDMRATEVVTQNLNPYRNGKHVKKAKKLTKVHKGKAYKLAQNIPEDISYTPSKKICFNGKGLIEKPNDAVKVESIYKGVTYLSSMSMIETSSGWVPLKDLRVQQGERLSNLGCPVCNSDHGDGRGDIGYAFAFRNDYDDLVIKCGGTACAGKKYLLKETPILGGLIVKEIIDLRKIKAYINNTGYSASNSMFHWVSSSGTSRYFRITQIQDFFNDILQDDLEQSNVNEILKNVLGKKALEFPKYIKGVYNEIAKVIMRENQYNSVEYRVDPFSENNIEIRQGVMRINSNRVFPQPPTQHLIDEAVIRDYKEHFKGFDDYLRLIAANRFGADRKQAYIWWRAQSNWGKSLLLENILGGLGIVVITKEAEIKMALKGSPSGLSAENFVHSWILFVDEFKGAISELKDITHNISFSSKGKQKSTVELFTKQFASAENVESLNGANGMEKQFANRFSIWQMSGDITKRELYAKDMEYYKNVLRTYCYDFLVQEVNRYLELGKAKASVEAQLIATGINEKYALKDIQDSMVYLRERVLEMFQEVIKRPYREEDGFLRDYKPYAEYFIVRDDILWVHNINKVKDLFLKGELSESEVKNYRHKSAKEVLGISDQSESKSIKIFGISRRCFSLCKVGELDAEI